MAVFIWQALLGWGSSKNPAGTGFPFSRHPKKHSGAGGPRQDARPAPRVAVRQAPFRRSSSRACRRRMAMTKSSMMPANSSIRPGV
jgi:hypothetical protein